MIDDIWQIDSLILFLVFFLPGFVSIKTYDILIPSERRDFSKAIFEAVGYSALNFTLLYPLISRLNSSYLYLVLVMIVFPILWSVLFAKLPNYRYINKYVRLPNPKPWDEVFGRRESYWVIVHLKSGIKIGGLYDVKSRSSSNPAEEQIYLEEVWKLDDDNGFIERVDRTKGIIILSEEISRIELLEK